MSKIRRSSQDANPTDSAADPSTTLTGEEVLRLRDLAFGERARAEVLSERVGELEGELHALGDFAESLQERLERSWGYRMSRRRERFQRRFRFLFRLRPRRRRPRRRSRRS